MDDSVVVTQICNKNKICEVLVNNCNSIADVGEFLRSSAVHDNLQDPEDILVVNFKFLGLIADISSAEIQGMCVNNLSRSIVIIMGDADENFKIYWKQKKMEHFMDLKLTGKLEADEKRSLNYFITNFITDSLGKDHHCKDLNHKLKT